MCLFKQLLLDVSYLGNSPLATSSQTIVRNGSFKYWTLHFLNCSAKFARMASEMWHNDYTVLIERLQQPRFTLNPSSGKLRFEISSHSTNLPSDPNNNTNNSTDGIENTSVRKLACFELLEDGIRSIRYIPLENLRHMYMRHSHCKCVKCAYRVVPTGSQQSFNVECIKSNGPTAETSTSVQVIHVRQASCI